jgi:glycosidase
VFYENRLATGGFLREVHVTRALRYRYGLEGTLASYRGGIVIADFATARRLSHAMNADRNLRERPEAGVRASDLNAYGLIEEIFHHLVSVYKEQVGADLFGRTLTSAKEQLLRQTAAGATPSSAPGAEGTLRTFLDLFPPTEVFTGEVELDDYLEKEIDGEKATEVALEEILMLWLANENPATEPFAELFSDEELSEVSSYSQLVDATRSHLETEPVFEQTGKGILETLLEPIRRHPDSLYAQLEFIRKEWGTFLGSFLLRMLRTLDFLKEERRPFFAGKGPQMVYEFAGAEYDEEAERFSPDREWMPRVVVLAKSTFVWLDQLSRKYGREINRLDQIPDEELDLIASRGFNGLWLIGLWERSRASRRIKQLTGNPDAAASAYSLMNYEISGDLGGWDALLNLRHRAVLRGIRLASDMVPNHTGLDSDWMQRHPDWFVQLDHPPFPNYSFNGENLSSKEGMEIYLEDHYYDRTDAAVVFKRRDSNTGEERYIYHGNDGTSMPWNDTAQLNFLIAEVREATIQTILHVARSFPIIRFDAAMTLAKKHFQRLWFPEPGGGGDIPTRGEHGLSRHDFDRAFPEEFWREVVDRVAAEIPDTLLLAEAFWMMEGYFVRTLGMHRVYNSAFMNMLKDEENQKYRQTIKNTVSFDKQILKRFVNFMNNPDEETAIAQFGSGDKYFGVCTMMVTMPGLPMFGHGQIEGFTEKYGMEYRRAMLSEEPNEDLVERHNREIFPLAKKRHLFAEVDSFLLFDVYGDHGVNENVYAFTNEAGGERALVLYNNAYDQAQGWIKDSAEYVEKDAGGNKLNRRSSLGEALGLKNDPNAYCILQEQRSGNWFVRRSSDLVTNGLSITLNGYESQVYLNIYEVVDDDAGNYRTLFDYLDGNGTTSIELAFQEIRLKPVYDAFRRLVSSKVASALAHNLYLASLEPKTKAKAKKTAKETPAATKTAGEKKTADKKSVEAEPPARPLELEEQEVKSFLDAFRGFLKEVENANGFPVAEEPSVKEARRLIERISQGIEDVGKSATLRKLSRSQPVPEIVLLPYLVFASIEGAEEGSLVDELVHTWLLYRVFEETMSAEVRDRLTQGAWRGLLDILLRESHEPYVGILHTAQEQAYAGVHEYEETTWFDRDRLYSLVFWRWLDAGCRGKKPLPVSEVEAIVKAAESSGYKLADFKKGLAKRKAKR